MPSTLYETTSCKPDELSKPVPKVSKLQDAFDSAIFFHTDGRLQETTRGFLDVTNYHGKNDSDCHVPLWAVSPPSAREIALHSPTSPSSSFFSSPYSMTGLELPCVRNERTSWWRSSGDEDEEIVVDNQASYLPPSVDASSKLPPSPPSVAKELSLAPRTLAHPAHFSDLGIGPPRASFPFTPVTPTHRKGSCTPPPSTGHRSRDIEVPPIISTPKVKSVIEREQLSGSNFNPKGFLVVHHTNGNKVTSADLTTPSVRRLDLIPGSTNRFSSQAIGELPAAEWEVKADDTVICTTPSSFPPLTIYTLFYYPAGTLAVGDDPDLVKGYINWGIQPCSEKHPASEYLPTGWWSPDKRRPARILLHHATCPWGTQLELKRLAATTIATFVKKGRRKESESSKAKKVMTVKTGNQKAKAKLTTAKKIGVTAAKLRTK